jgi:hypothetical protein
MGVIRAQRATIRIVVAIRKYMKSKTFNLQFVPQGPNACARGAIQRRSGASTQMLNIAMRFVAHIRRNLESWRAHEIDFVTFTESQREIWAAIRTVGAETAVLRALTGSAVAPNVLVLEDELQRTVQMPTIRNTAAALARRYCGTVARTATGSPVLRVSSSDPRDRPAEHRQVAALIYELAADMERCSYQLEAHWTIAADPDNGELVIELTGAHEAELAEELVANVMTQHELL